MKKTQDGTYKRLELAVSRIILDEIENMDTYDNITSNQAMRVSERIASQTTQSVRTYIENKVTENAVAKASEKECINEKESSMIGRDRGDYVLLPF